MAEASALIVDNDPVVLSALASNYAVDRNTLGELARRNPELRELVAMNVNAPADVKGTLPLRQHVESALTEFFDEVCASSDERSKLREMFVASIRTQNDVTLADAWTSITSPVEKDPPALGR